MQRLNFLKNNWILGSESTTGVDLASVHRAHLETLDIPVLTEASTKVDVSAQGVKIDVLRRGSIQRSFEALAIIIATGTRFRSHEYVSKIAGWGSLLSSTVFFGPFAFSKLALTGQSEVLILGGGDNAFENAKILRDLGCRVTIVCRSNPKAQRKLVESVRANHPGSGVELFCESAVVNVIRLEEKVEVRLRSGKEQIFRRVSRIHVLYGYEPNVSFLKNWSFTSSSPLALDSAGYVVVESGQRTSVNGVYAAGDVCNPNYPSVITAPAQGAIAAKSIEMDSRC